MHVLQVVNTENNEVDMACFLEEWLLGAKLEELPVLKFLDE